MKNIREEIDRELSSVTFESIQRELPEELPARKDRNMKISRKFIALGTAAALVVGSTVTVGAVNDWDYSRIFRALMPWSQQEEEPEFLMKFTGPIPEDCITNTFENFDVVPHGYIFDGTNLLVSLDFVSKDGTVFTKENQKHYLFGHLDNMYNSYSSLEVSCGPQEEGSLHTWIRVLYTEPFYPGQTVKVGFKNLVYLDEDDKDENGRWKEAKTAVEGTVTLELTLNEMYTPREFTLYEDGSDETSEELTLGASGDEAQASAEPHTATVVLSPLSMVIHSWDLTDTDKFNEALERYAQDLREKGFDGDMFAFSHFRFEEIGEHFALIDTEGNVLLRESDLNLADSLSANKHTGEITIKFRKPIDADTVARIEWDNYESR